MHISDMDSILWLISDAAKALLLGIFVWRRLYRAFPVFFAYISWDMLSDCVLFAILSTSHGYLNRHYVNIYYSTGIITYLLEVGVLLEIASSVLRPAARIFPFRMLYWFLGAIFVVGVGSFFFAKLVNPAPFLKLRIFLLMDTTAGFMCLITFVLIASFSQIIGLTWKNHVLQLATGLAFYSFIELLVRLIQSQLHASPSYAAQYRFWSRNEVIGYVGTVFFWCYAFLKQEAPRKEFSPQMQKILVQLSGSAKRQTAVLARSREP